MRSIDFQDSFHKIPASERIQQQAQQQPGVNQEINIRDAEKAAGSRIDSPQAQDAVENVIVERRKRDREFREKKRKKNGKPGKSKDDNGGPAHLVDMIG